MEKLGKKFQVHIKVLISVLIVINLIFMNHKLWKLVTKKLVLLVLSPFTFSKNYLIKVMEEKNGNQIYDFR